ncbi:MAG: type II secretion system protein [Planctomycetes bacterium]|nr:type II secretion system protein [Planctomycetota bacterium]
MTLIELLVVIIILTTLVAGVIPVLSPNNDARKIREASRGLQSYIMLAQSKAAQTGRPHGIAFRESAPGVALDVFQLEVPPPFAGFSSASAARIIREEFPAGSGTFRYYVQFILADTATGIPPVAFPPILDYQRDPVPPRFVRYKDEVTIAGTRYRLIDKDFDGNGTQETIIPDDGFYNIDITINNHREWTFLCEPVNNSDQTLAYVYSYLSGGNTYSLTAPKQHQIIRQPVNSPESPYQLPAGVAIDMQGSVTEGSSVPGRFPTNSSLFVPGGTLDTVGIMFSPTGSVSSVYLNGTLLTSVSRLVLLMGRVENGGLIGGPTGPPAYNNAEWTIASGASNDVLSELQEKINWLNLDTRWLSIAASSGRVVVTENAFVDARAFGGDPALLQVERQLEAAHQFAHEMKTGGGG